MVQAQTIKHMNIVITDGFTLNPGDQSWAVIEALGSVTYYDRSSSSEVPERCAKAEVIITNKTPISAATISSATNLKLIAVTATGYNIVDVAAAQARGVVVCNVPGYGTDSVAQHTWSLLLELSNQVGLHAQSVRAGEWVESADWCYLKSPIVELAGKTLGIVGFGRIGQQVAAVGRAFGMRVIFHNRSVLSGTVGEQRSLSEVFAESDVISLHCPLTVDNQGFVNAILLGTMKPSAFLLNTARGQLINEQDLADALNGGVLAGAGLDVLSTEPPAANNPLLGAKNCILTPHTAWISYEARRRVMAVTGQNIKAFAEGTPQNVVS
jgi:glycerate dehydrogenase